ALDGFGRKFDLLAEIGRQLSEQLNASNGLKFIPPQQGLERQGGLAWENSLTQARRQMRVLAERIVFAREQLFEVRLGQARVSDHDGVGGDVAQALAGGVKKGDDASDKIESGQGVHETQQIAHDNLVELQPQEIGRASGRE